MVKDFSMSECNTSQKVISRGAAARWVKKLQAQGRKVVFTNGCFDLLHPGHVAYLEQARSLGDALIVGVNTDESVQRLFKGPGRPVTPEADRARVLAALTCVDRVVLFPEDTPLELLTALQPDVLVKGGDYQLQRDRRPGGGRSPGRARPGPALRAGVFYDGVVGTDSFRINRPTDCRPGAFFCAVCSAGGGGCRLPIYSFNPA